MNPEQIDLFFSFASAATNLAESAGTAICPAVLVEQLPPPLHTSALLRKHKVCGGEAIRKIVFEPIDHFQQGNHAPNFSVYLQFQRQRVPWHRGTSPFVHWLSAGCGPTYLPIGVGLHTLWEMVRLSDNSWVTWAYTLTFMHS